MPEPPVALSRKRAEVPRSASSTPGPVEVRWVGAPLPLPAGFAEPGYAPDGRRSRLGRRGAVLLRWPDGREVYHRCFAHGGLVAGLCRDRYASAARLERELADAARLRAAGIATPEPICGRIERTGPWFRLALVTVRVVGETLQDLCEAGPGAAVLVATGRGLARLHEAGFRHRDLHPGNLIVAPDGEVWVLDLEGGSWGGAPGDASARRSLVRLARYFEKHTGRPPSPSWCLALLRGYEPDAGARRRLWSMLRDAYRRSLRWHRLLWAVRRG